MITKLKNQNDLKVQTQNLCNEKLMTHDSKVQTDLPVSVVVPVKNEEVNISHCLEHLKGFSEVIVVDSGSTDRTKDIALSNGAKVLEFQWDGKFPKKRNWTLRNYKFSNDWVLFVDADEYLTPQFKKELCGVLSNTDKVGFWVTYHNYFMDRLLKHGDPFKKLSLFRVGVGEYERIEEDGWSNFDMEIHEHPVLDGSIGTLKSPIIHKDFKGLKAYISRHNEYSSWEAEHYLDVMKKSGGSSGDMTFRQRIKYKFLNTWLLGPAYFFISYIIKFGFLDGKAGFMFALLKMHYFIQIKLKIYESQKMSY